MFSFLYTTAALIAVLENERLFMEAEQKRMDAMTPEQRTAYIIAKRDAEDRDLRRREVAALERQASAVEQIQRRGWFW